MTVQNRLIMIVFKLSSILAGLVFLLGLFSSCEKEPKADYKSFLIQVDSIQLPDEISVNTSFDISFYGTIGTNGCYKFSEFRTEKLNTDILIETWGKLDLKSEICPSVMVFLNGKKSNYLIEEAGSYMIKIKQPGNSFLEKQIIVE